MEINHLFKDIPYIHNVFLTLLSFIKKETSKKGLFFVSNEYYTCLSFVHIKKMQELKPSHHEYWSNHFHK